MKDMRKKDQKLQRRDKKKTGFEELNGKLDKIYIGYVKYM